MIKIEHPVFASPEQMMFVIEGMRNPLNSHHLSDTKIDKKNGELSLGARNFDLMKRLAKSGKDHRKYLRMMPVYVQITAPMYWWKEADTYKIGTVANSTSTMHKIHAKEFTLDDFSCEHLISSFAGNKQKEMRIGIPDNEEYVYYSPLNILDLWIIPALNSYREEFLETKDKEIWWQMIQLLPSSYNQTRNVSLNYEVLLNMYFARRKHKLDEWREFCQWMLDNVPYFKELVDYIEGDKKVSKGIKFSYVDKEERVKSLKEFFSAEGFEVPDEELAAMEVGLPKRATKGSAGYDCYSPIGFTLSPGEEIKLPTLIKAYMPQDVFLGVYPRSGLGFKYYARLANTVGIIDSDYVDNESNEGHIFVKIRNEGDKPMSVNPGDGICQFIFQKYYTTDDDDSEGKREGGFGSTGK